ncbi:MAG: N,N-dimethylformamidase beta subunit family domain-containing protein [Pseudonocardiaceae bacterium]
MRENQRPGTTAWQIHGRTPDIIAGYADRTYAADGDTTTLYASTTAPYWHVEAYRIGYYHGTGARLVWRSPELTGKQQPPCPVEPGTNMASCDNWSPAVRVTITKTFVPGDYLLKLLGSGGQQSYIPLTVWDPDSHATYLIKNDVLTWQAWNPYGGYDYYVGQGHCARDAYPLCSRARVVSFDRPYDLSYNGGQGTGDFLALELPLIRWVEQHGLDVTYATDLTVIEHPHILTAHRAMLSLGHDECWSLRERQATVAAHQAGVNLAFFGASAILRHVRIQPSLLGADREEVDYRDSAADPLDGHGDPLRVTGNTWASPPADWPEDDFVGESYNGFLDPTAPSAALRIVDAAAWIFTGVGLHDGQTVPDVIRSDVDSLEPGLGHPPNVEILAHSPMDAHHAQARVHTTGTFYSDMTYYTGPDGHAGVWDAGTNNWIPDLTPCTSGQPCPASIISAITANLLRLFGSGPAGTTHPSIPNWQTFYPHGSP